MLPVFFSVYKKKVTYFQDFGEVWEREKKGREREEAQLTEKNQTTSLW